MDIIPAGNGNPWILTRDYRGYGLSTSGANKIRDQRRAWLAARRRRDAEVRIPEDAIDVFIEWLDSAEFSTWYAAAKVTAANPALALAA